MEIIKKYTSNHRIVVNEGLYNEKGDIIAKLYQPQEKTKNGWKPLRVGFADAYNKLEKADFYLKEYLSTKQLIVNN